MCFILYFKMWMQDLQLIYKNLFLKKLAFNKPSILNFKDLSKWFNTNIFILFFTLKRSVGKDYRLHSIKLLQWKVIRGFYKCIRCFSNFLRKKNQYRTWNVKYPSTNILKFIIFKGKYLENLKNLHLL